MPKQDDEIFKFDPTSFWRERNHVNVINEETEIIEYLSAFKFEADNRQNLQRINQLYCQDNLTESILRSERIRQIAQWLRKKYQLFNLIAEQLAFHLIKLYEHLFRISLRKTKVQFTEPLLPFKVIRDLSSKSKSVNLCLNQTELKQIVQHIESSLTPKLEAAEIWSRAADELLTYQPEIALLINKIQQEVEEISGSLASDNKVSLFLQQFTQREVSVIFERLKFDSLTLEDLDNILGLKKDNVTKPVPNTESKLANAVVPVPTFAAFSSAITAQIRKDLWGKDDNGIAYFKHQAKNNSQNYIEHYISNPGDIEVLPWEQAEQIIDKFGFNTVKLHLIFAAHTMNQPTPWSGKFNLKASDVIKYLGWDKRTDLPIHEKLSEIAKAAFVLDCLLVKSVWVEGRNKKGEIDASTPTGRMWNVVVDPRGQLNLEGKVEKPKEVYITVQPGLIFHSFLNKAGSRLREALYQFGYLAQDILRIDPYHDELALRLAIHLTMDSRIHTSGKYRVETLLKHLLPHTVIDTARSDKRKGYDLKQRWDNALKLLMNLKWQIQFDESYPEWLQPGSKAKKPNEARKMKIIEWLLQAKITIKPPEPIPKLLTTNAKPKPKVQNQKRISATGITSDQIRKGRNAMGWSQRKLAGWLGVSNALIGYWEKGKRTPSEEMEKKLRDLLQIED
jgi:DNA-binding transcriptional regulator YiaG